jgi:hypothetical protein
VARLFDSLSPPPERLTFPSLPQKSRAAHGIYSPDWAGLWDRPSGPINWKARDGPIAEVETNLSESRTEERSHEAALPERISRKGFDKRETKKKRAFHSPLATLANWLLRRRRHVIRDIRQWLSGCRSSPGEEEVEEELEEDRYDSYPKLQRQRQRQRQRQQDKTAFGASWKDIGPASETMSGPLSPFFVRRFLVLR